MAKRLLVETRPKETRLALVEDGRLLELSIEREAKDTLTGSIFVGRVDNAIRGMEAAFVDIGLDKNAFLPLEIGENGKKLSVSAGQDVLVQVVKIPGGEKGARLSTEISLPGRMCVLMPNSSYSIGISKRIESEEERKRLFGIARELVPKDMALIVRTAAEGAEREALKKDVNTLLCQWEDIKRRSQVLKGPALIKRDDDQIMRAVRDHLTEDVEEMLFEDEEAFHKGLNACDIISADMKCKLRLSQDEIPLFKRFSVPSQIEKALSRRVWLKSGGYLIFDKTEAMTVIDVNSGKYTGNKTLSDTIFRINMEAAEEIALQLRLRDIGGIIIIDFIDMDTADKKAKLLDFMREKLKNDPTHTKLGGITSLGLVELTRKKKREPIASYLKSPCPVCAGAGEVTSLESAAYDAAGEIYAKNRANEGIFLLKASKRVIDAFIEIGFDLTMEAYALEDKSLPTHEYTVQKIAKADITDKMTPIGRR
ncbi:MAG: Rne/Rng family ribonuclease [Clostridia bacterium]|nr:Rne/Rng family ribonuclease [Clostridia bacterium]